MAHNDFGETCPIFAEGVEKEMVLPVFPSITCTDCMQAAIPWGREGTVINVFFQTFASTGTSKSISCTVGIFFDQSMSTPFGSVPYSTAHLEFSTSTGMIPISASLTTSLNFTSTDYLGIAFITPQSQPRTILANVVVRYRDK